MESLAYLINRHFTIIAVDTHYQMPLGDSVFKIPNAKKVYKLNDTNLIAVIGNPVKTTNVNKYILKLNEYGHNQTFDEIVADVNDVFNTTKTNLIDNLKHIVDVLPQYYNEAGEVKLTDLANSFKEKPELISVLNDALLALNDSSTALTQVMVFGWDLEDLKCKVAHLVSMGDNLFGNDNNLLAEDFIYIKFATSDLEISKKTKDIEAEAIQKFNNFLIPGWDNDNDKVQEIIELGKTILQDGIRQICPYKEEPNIIFYELSPNTNSHFIEPDIHLTKIEVSTK